MSKHESQCSTARVLTAPLDWIWETKHFLLNLAIPTHKTVKTHVSVLTVNNTLLAGSLQFMIQLKVFLKSYNSSNRLKSAYLMCAPLSLVKWARDLRMIRKLNMNWTLKFKQIIPTMLPTTVVALFLGVWALIYLLDAFLKVQFIYLSVSWHFKVCCEFVYNILYNAPRCFQLISLLSALCWVIVFCVQFYSW